MLDHHSIILALQNGVTTTFHHFIDIHHLAYQYSYFLDLHIYALISMIAYRAIAATMITNDDRYCYCMRVILLYVRYYLLRSLLCALCSVLCSVRSALCSLNHSAPIIVITFARRVNIVPAGRTARMASMAVAPSDIRPAMIHDCGGMMYDHVSRRAVAIG